MIELDVGWCIVIILILKIFIFGGGFNFWDWFRCGKRYTDWYKRRPKFNDVVTELIQDELDEREWNNNDTDEEEEADWHSRTFEE